MERGCGEVLEQPEDWKHCGAVVMRRENWR